ncbi:MAG: hypothetical protein IJL67_11970 [Oscillospiraceae bacterium]|nr:hypothetical protein [Oscillospiraceae bacterium]MBQ5990199.1 hypothetical protein [Oscillospiraceae bacterium]
MSSRRVNVEVVCPVVSGRFDFVIDTGLTAAEAAGKIASEVRESLKADIIAENDGLLLYASGSRLPLDPEERLEKYGVTNGSILMLIQEQKK